MGLPTVPTSIRQHAGQGPGLAVHQIPALVLLVPAHSTSPISSTAPPHTRQQSAPRSAASKSPAENKTSCTSRDRQYLPATAPAAGLFAPSPPARSPPTAAPRQRRSAIYQDQPYCHFCDILSRRARRQNPQGTGGFRPGARFIPHVLPILNPRQNSERLSPNVWGQLSASSPQLADRRHFATDRWGYSSCRLAGQP